MAFALAALSDEIAPDLDLALRTMAELGIHEVEVRTLLGKNVLELTDAEAAACAAQIARAGFTVSGIASPIGKSPITQPAEHEARRLARALELCRVFGTRRVRVFSYYPPQGADQAQVEGLVPEVIRRLGAWAEMAAAAGVLLVLENEYRLVGDVPTRAAAILRGVDSPALRFAWDPGNFVHSGIERPFDSGWPLLGSLVTCCHVKDRRRSGEHVPVGQGDGQWEPLVAALVAQGGVPLVMEPHLVVAAHSTGFSGPERFREAVGALRRLLPAVA